MRKIALLTIPLLVLGLAPLTAAPLGGAHELTIPTITTVESSDDMMMSSMDMMMDVEHTHDMGTADDMEDDVTHIHDTQTHTHDMGTADDMTDDVTHYHGEYAHTHGEEDMLNAPGHVHGFHPHVVGEVDSAENEETDDYMHYHLGGGFDDEHTHEWFRSGPTVDVTGSSTLTFGINLGNNATGFTNSAEADVKVTLIGETSVASDTPANTDDLYAEIKLEKLKWEIGSAEGQGPTTAPEISTMLKMGAFSIQTYSAPKIVVDFVDDDDEDDADVTDLKVEYKGSGGLKLGYDVEPVMLRLSVISKDDWKDDKDKCTNQHSHVVGKKDDDKNNETDDIHHCHAPVADTEAEVDGAYADDNHIHGTSDDDKQVGWTRPTRGKVTEDHANEDNAYAFLGEVHLDIGEKADLDAAVAYAHEYADGGSAIGIGAKATFDLDNIDPYIAFDGSVPPDDSGIAWDVGGGVKWTLSTKDEESYFDAGLLMYAPAGKDSQLGVMVTLKEGDEDKGSLLGLGAEISVGLNNVTADASDWSAKIAGHYKVEGIKPFFDVTFNSKEGSKLPFTAGLELSMLKHLTTTIQYMSTNVTGDKPDRGEVTAAIKIEY